ncbi:uncharacterized protein [Dermacentor albipictus]|uniref:uncharacterized protein isoform X2 n=1 Tax=Dermacentor albipictus TaxID=60249 RepID=UPI0031FC4690
MDPSFPSSVQSGSPPLSSDEPQTTSPRSSGPAISASGVATLLASAPAAPRLCHLVRWPEYDGYGFKLLSAEHGHLPRVTAVEFGSPAEAAGLRVNDTVVEVNDASLEGLAHQEAVRLVKSIPNEAHLLVVDDETAAWYKRHGIAIRADLPNVVHTSSKVSSTRKPRRKQDGTASISSTSSGSMTPAELAGGLRLCYLRKWKSYEGYGFSLREDKERQGYFITGVMPNSPAELGGLRDDDRLVEVNAVSVENKSYPEIMGRIEKEPDQVDLLVIDRETDEAFASRSQRPSGQADGVLRRWTPGRPPRLTSRKSKKPENGASLQHVTASTANVAEGAKAVAGEMHHVSTENGALVEHRQKLPTALPCRVSSGSPSFTQRKGPDYSGHASISVESSEVVSAVVNGASVDGVTYREVINRIKMDPGKVDLLVIDRETDELFARQGKTPSSQAHCVVEGRTPPRQPESYGRASGFRHPFSEALKTCDAPTAVSGLTPRNASLAANKPLINQQSKPLWPVNPLPEHSELVATRSTTVAPGVLRNDDKATSLRITQDTHITPQWEAKTQPAKSERRESAKPPPKLYTIEESPKRSTTAASVFMTPRFRVLSEPYDNGSPSRCSVRNAADYFIAFEESSGPTSTEFSPVRSGTLSNHDSPHYSPMPATPATSGETSYALTQPCGPYCPAQSWLSMSYQAPYVPLESVPQQERWTTYAPGYSDYLTMYSGYASKAPLNSATETTPGLRQTPAECCGAENLHAPLYDLAISPSGSRNIVVPPEPKDSARSSANASNEDEGTNKSDNSDRANRY